MKIYMHLNDLGCIKIKSLIRFFACVQSFHLLKNLMKDASQRKSMECEEMSIHDTEKILVTCERNSKWL